MQSIGTLRLWIVFFVIISFIFVIDLIFLKGRKSHRVSTREAFFWVLTWVISALIFNAILWWNVDVAQGSVIARQKTLEFFTGYILEKSLSIDNMFVILMIFNFLSIPLEYQRRVLMYGVIGAIFLRLIFILSGIWLVNQFHWVLYLFGIFLIYSGIKMLLLSDNKTLSENRLVQWLEKHLPLTNRLDGEKFFIKQNLDWYVTPLFLALILIEAADVIFAFDSIPAIFSITRDPFIVFTSNIFAILGLRALYFLLLKLAKRFYLLKYGIAVILVFVGIKMLIEPLISISILVTLGVLAVILITAIILSLRRGHHEESRG